MTNKFITQQVIDANTRGLQNLGIKDEDGLALVNAQLQSDGTFALMGIGSLAEYSPLETSKGVWKKSLLERFPEIDLDQLFVVQSASMMGYQRDFCCGDNFYRGTAENPGITLGLNAVEGAKCYGAILSTDLTKIGLSPERIPEFVEYYWQEYKSREEPPNMPIYEFGIESPQVINGPVIPSIICKADINGPMYYGGMDPIEVARIIATSRGPTQFPEGENKGQPKPRGSQTNLDYLRAVVDSSERFNIPVEQHLLNLYTMSVASREALPAHEKNRLEMFENPGSNSNKLNVLADFLTSAAEGRIRVQRQLGIELVA